MTEADLRQFTGSEHWYLHGLVRNVLFTDGAKLPENRRAARYAASVVVGRCRNS